jgi:glycosyltransferase involved in cell wall biosynthesis
VVRAHLDLGHRVDVVTFPIGEDFKGEGLRFFRASNPLGIGSVPIGFSFRKIILDLTLILALRRRLRADSYQLIHALEESAFPAVLLGRRAKIPVLYDMHSRLSEGLAGFPGLGRGPLRRVARRLEEWLFRRASIIVTSKGLADQVRAVCPDAKLFEWHFSGTLENGTRATPDSLRRSLRIPADAPVVLYSGTFTPYQGIDLFLQAAAVVARSEPRRIFVLVGCEGGEAEGVLAVAKRLGIEAGIRIVDRQPRPKMHSYFDMADVLVSPRISGDNVPLKIFDYLAADRPIVATDIPTHRTVLDDSLALLVSPTPEALGGGIRTLLNDGALAQRLREAAGAYAHEHLGWPIFVDSLRRIHSAAIHGD